MRKLTQPFKNQRGSITIEMAFVIMGFVALFAIIVDFGIVMLKYSKLERTNASLAATFREREALYRDNKTLTKDQAEAITQEQTNQLGQLAVKLLNEPLLSMRIDAVYFDSTPNSQQQTIQTQQTFYFGDRECTSVLAPLSNNANLSPYSNFNRWMPLYRISICIPAEMSWYKSIISPDAPQELASGKMIVSNITIPR